MTETPSLPPKNQQHGPGSVAIGDHLWTPSPHRVSATHMARFVAHCSSVLGRQLSYNDLYEWSVTDLAAFWREVAAFTGIKWQVGPTNDVAAVFEAPAHGGMRGASWFPQSQLNVAENLLSHGDGKQTAIISHVEGGVRREFSREDLRQSVMHGQRALERLGVGRGDRVAGVMSNVYEAIVAMLATTSIGAVWSSCSPDFGVEAIVDRIGQIAPKVVFFMAGYRYGGKSIDCLAQVNGVMSRLGPDVKAVVTSFPGMPPVENNSQWMSWEQFQKSGCDNTKITFAPTVFGDPLYIMFSSGTTGVPKCIVHSAGGTLLQHHKELMLHSDIGPGDRLFFYTTCGWMMWNWMVSALSVGTSLVLYDGAVHVPNTEALWSLVAKEKVTHFGTSPKFIGVCMGEGESFLKTLDLEKAPLRCVLSTGAPLLPEHFQWIYRQVKADVHLSSISGGTDIIGCFMLGNPTAPVYAGEIQGPGLGMAIAAWDDSGNPVPVGVPGELVCTKPFVSMPLGFWQDSDGTRFQKAYFDFYPGKAEVWRHGDFVAMTEHGGIVVYGRSDATLNPGGIRIGTAELYRYVESMPEVTDSIAIGQKTADDTRVVLFVKLKEGMTLDEALTKKIKTHIRTSLTPRHVPAVIAHVKEIPYTRSGKKVELAVTQAIHGEPVKNLAALVRPDVLDEYKALAQTVLKLPT